MRSPLAALFDEALNSCFSLALEAILGRPVREEVYRILERKGIAGGDVSIRFDDVVGVLTEVFGGCSRVIVHRMVVELFREYSQRVDFSYDESLKDRLLFLRERVVADHLSPRRVGGEHSFFAKNKGGGEEGSGVEAGGHAGWSGFYPLKRGVGLDQNRG